MCSEGGLLACSRWRDPSAGLFPPTQRFVAVRVIGQARWRSPGERARAIADAAEPTPRRSGERAISVAPYFEHVARWRACISNV